MCKVISFEDVKNANKEMEMYNSRYFDKKLSAIKPENIKNISLIPNFKSDPAISILANNEIVNFPIINGFQIHSINELLRKLDFDLTMNIEFKTYRQYTNLIEEVNLRLHGLKVSMFYAADETNAKFNAMPVTFAQAWQGIQDDLLMTFQPVIETIAQGAGWIHENWSTIEPVFWGLTAAVAAYALITGISAAATWLSVAANQALIVTMLSNPILWIAILIGFLVAKLYQWVQSVGGVKIAWMIAMNAIKTAGDWAWIGIMTGVNWVMNSFNKFQLTVMTVSTAIQNFMGDMKAGVLMTLENMVNGAIGIINDFIAVLNKIPGVSIEAVAQVSFGTTAELENQANKAARNAELTDYANDVAAKISARDMALNQMKTDALAATAQRQADIDAAQIQAAAKQDSSMYDGFDGMASSLKDISGNTGDIRSSVLDSKEDLKYMIDLATEAAIDRYAAANVKVEIHNTNTINNEMDIDGVVDKLNESLTETIAITSRGVHK